MGRRRGAVVARSRSSKLLELLADGEPHHYAELAVAVGHPREKVAGSLTYLVKVGKVARLSPRTYRLGRAPARRALAPTWRPCGHRVRQRFARWLLEACEGQEELHAPQAFIAEMIHAEQTTVGAYARAMRRAGLISARYGCVSVVDRRGLERASCECYRATQKTGPRTLGKRPEDRPLEKGVGEELLAARECQGDRRPAAGALVYPGVHELDRRLVGARCPRVQRPTRAIRRPDE